MSALNCPHCLSELPEDFGFLQCDSCGAIVTVDMDGNIQLPNDESDSLEPNESNSELISLDELEAEIGEWQMSSDANVSEEPLDEVLEMDTLIDELEREHLVSEEVIESDGEDKYTNEASKIISENKDQDHALTDYQEFYHKDKGLDSKAVIDQTNPGVKVSEVDSFFSEIEWFSEQESHTEEDGTVYDLTISSVNGDEKLGYVIDAIEDSRLSLSRQFLLESYQQDEGILYLKSISYLHLTIIVNRLLTYDLQIDWKSRSMITEDGSTDQEN